MEVNVRERLVQAHRGGIADEVDLVPAMGEFLAQFGRDDAASAVGGIARDADSQASSGERIRSGAGYSVATGKPAAVACGVRRMSGSRKPCR